MISWLSGWSESARWWLLTGGSISKAGIIELQDIRMSIWKGPWRWFGCLLSLYKWGNCIFSLLPTWANTQLLIGTCTLPLLGVLCGGKRPAKQVPPYLVMLEAWLSLPQNLLEPSSGPLTLQLYANTLAPGNRWGRCVMLLLEGHFIQLNSDCISGIYNRCYFGAGNFSKSCSCILAAGNFLYHLVIIFHFRLLNPTDCPPGFHFCHISVMAWLRSFKFVLIDLERIACCLNFMTQRCKLPANYTTMVVNNEWTFP